jgi:hypothetical protein
VYGAIRDSGDLAEDTEEKLKAEVEKFKSHFRTSTDAQDA